MWVGEVHLQPQLLAQQLVSQVAYALRQAEAGTPVADVCRQLGIAEATF